MEVTSWNLNHGSSLMVRTSWYLPQGFYSTEVTSWNQYHERYLVDVTPWKLPHGTYTKENT